MYSRIILFFSNFIVKFYINLVNKACLKKQTNEYKFSAKEFLFYN